MAEDRGLGRVFGQQLQLAREKLLQLAQKAGEIQRLFERIAQRLLHQRVLRHLARALQVVETSRGVGKDALQQVLGVHALQLVRHARAAAVARHRERERGGPAPARLENRRVEDCLHQCFAHRIGMQVAEHLLQRERMRRAERQEDALLRRRRLQLEIEALAELLAQSEAPGAVDAAAERRVQHQLHAARFVEEALEHQRLRGRNGAECALALAEIGRDLLRRGSRQEVMPDKKIDGRTELSLAPRHVRPRQQGICARAQPRYRRGHFVAARRRLAEPERHRRRLAFSVRDAHYAVADAQDAPGSVAELEHVARQRFDGEVLVQRAEEVPFGLEQHAVVEHFRDRAAVEDGAHARALAGAQLALDRVVVDQRAASAVARGVAARKHLHHVLEIGWLEIFVRESPADEREQRVLFPLFLRGGLCDDLLREDVERRVGNGDAVQLAVSHAPQHRGALDQVVARQRKHPALGHAAHRVTRAPDALQERGDAVRRGNLADQVDVADVDAELERGGRHQHLELAVAQARLRLEARFLGEAPVVRRYVFIT